MTLQEFCENLPKRKQIELALTLAQKALPIWYKHVQENKLVYRDSVVGLNHEVPNELLADAVKEIKKYSSRVPLLRFFKSKKKLLKLHSYFADPIVALQDSDWKLPAHVEKVFYSIYNLLGSVLGKQTTVFNEQPIYVSINQTIEALDTAGIFSESQIKEILKSFQNSNAILQS